MTKKEYTSPEATLIFLDTEVLDGMNGGKSGDGVFTKRNDQWETENDVDDDFGW